MSILKLFLLLTIRCGHIEIGLVQAQYTLTENNIIQLHPESQAVTLNSTVRLQCRVRLLRDPQTGTTTQVYWSKNDFGMGGNRQDIQEYGRSSRYPYSRYDLPYNLAEGQYDLQITNVELSDEGAFVCQVNFMKQQYLSQTAVLTVQVPSEAPKLMQCTRGGRGKEIEVGSSIPAIVDDGDVFVLKCLARHGKPGAHLMWLIDGVPIQLEPVQPNQPQRFRAGFVGNLTTSIVPSVNLPRLKDSISQISARLSKLHHGKLIECRATNTGYGEHALRPAFTKLEVHYAPIVSIQIRPQRNDNEYMEHDIITVECTAHGRPDAFVWEWFVNGRQVENIADPWYRLRLTKNMHNAVFRCIAISNKKGHAETTVQVKFSPQFVEPSPLLYTASLNEDVVMKCPARGHPIPRIDWRREGGHEVLHHGVIYRRDNLREEDFGTYTCTAYSNAFPQVSKQMYIAKRRPPVIQPNPVVHARLGRSTRLRCTVNSVPLPSADQTHWYFQNRALRADGQHRFLREEFIGGVVLVLELVHVMRTDYGLYNCSVQNGYGSDWKLIELIYQEDIPLQFIIGAAVTIGILIIAGLVLICVCRSRTCSKRYNKGHPSPTSNSHASKSSNRVQHPDYGMTTSEYKSRASYSDSLYQENLQPWFNSSNSQNPYIKCGVDADDQRYLNNGYTLNYDQYVPASSRDLNTVTPTYGTNLSSYQIVQPLCNGTGYISAIDQRYFSSAEPSFYNVCPTLLSTTDVNYLQGHSGGGLQTCGATSELPMPSAYLVTTADGHINPCVSHLTSLDLTTDPNSVQVDGENNGRTTADPRHSYAIYQTNEQDGVDALTKEYQLQTVTDETNMKLLPELHGITYVINEHATNV